MDCDYTSIFPAILNAVVYLKYLYLISRIILINDKKPNGSSIEGT